MMKNRFATVLLLIPICGFVAAQEPSRRQQTQQARLATRSLARLAASGAGNLLRDDFEKLELSPRLKQWLSDHREAIVGAGRSPFSTPTKWGVATTNGNKLFLHIAQWPKEGNKLLIPRLHNSVKAAKYAGKELKLKPNVKDWEITLPEKPDRRGPILPVVELELNEPAVLATEQPVLVKAAADGSIPLHSRYSIVHGEMLRFEPQPHKNTVGYWVNEKDWAEWLCQPQEAGRYEVHLRYGCGNGQGGSEIAIQIGDQKLTFIVEATGGFQAWRDVSLGKVELTRRPVRVTVKPIRKAKNAVMDIQQITLKRTS